jgi:polypeptide N-acetylgalactosaminyltransferase
MSAAYSDVTLPTATVIIPFYNEALTMLLRAIHSVLNRSPDRLLDEIILVDDCSPDKDLQVPLSNYLKLLPKVRLIRHEHRQGLIVSRMDGARLAKSPVLFFMDAHAEVNVGWLEPLLAELKRNPKQILQPFIDGIDAMTLAFTAPGVYHKGAFSWDLRYTWIRVKDHEQQQAMETGLPFFTPTLVGCAIAVQREYFFNLGAFDEGLRVWGGENIELGFRAWQCGGQVTTVTCSRVGHVFKEFPYQFDGNKEEIVQKNLIRVSETWMDGMRKYFYASTRIYEFKRAELNSPEELRSLEERKELRKRLGCHNFEWYMHNVIPEVPIPPMDATHYGEIKNLQTQACWVVTTDYYLSMTYVCYHHKIIPENNFALTSDGLLRYYDRCVASLHSPYLQLVECPSHSPDKSKESWWELKKSGVAWGSLVYHLVTGNKTNSDDWCITQVTNAMPYHQGDQMPQLLRCNDDDKFQQWSFTYGFDFKEVPPTVIV